MPEKKRAKKKVAHKKLARRKKTRHVAVESDGKIRFRATFGELKEFAENSPFSTNRAILRAAISRLEESGVPNATIAYITFGMSGPHRS